MDEGERFAAGMEVRRAVLGETHVDKALANQNSFTEEFQDLITRYTWRELWARTGLTLHTRSLVTLAMMIALNRPDEFRMHVRAAIHNQVTHEEIKELLLHSAIYCGVPAANHAFHVAEQVLGRWTPDNNPRPEMTGHFQGINLDCSRSFIPGSEGIRE